MCQWTETIISGSIHHCVILIIIIEYFYFNEKKQKKQTKWWAANFSLFLFCFVLFFLCDDWMWWLNHTRNTHNTFHIDIIIIFSKNCFVYVENCNSFFSWIGWKIQRKICLDKRWTRSTAHTHSTQNDMMYLYYWTAHTKMNIRIREKQIAAGWEGLLCQAPETFHVI